MFQQNIKDWDWGKLYLNYTVAKRGDKSCLGLTAEFTCILKLNLEINTSLQGNMDTVCLHRI